MRGVVAHALLVLLATGPLAAQDTTRSTDLPPWRSSHFPYFTLSPNDGLMGIARVIFFRQARFDDRVTLHDQVSVEGGYSTRDAWRVTAHAAFPRIADGWRLEADGEAGRMPRFGDPEEPQELAHRGFGLEVTRRVRGPLHLALRGDASHFTNHLGLIQAGQLYPTAPITYPTAPDDNGVSIIETDYRGRVALVLDLRDREFDTQNGALVQAGYFGGSAADRYHGVYGLASGWFSPMLGTRATARVGLRDISHSGAIGIEQTMPAWEDPFVTLGGPQSDRALAIGQAPGRGLLLAGAELRRDLHTIHNIAALTFIAFVDAGRSFRDPAICPTCLIPINGGGGDPNSGNLELTLKGWTVGAGGGFAIRLLRDARLTVTAARAAEKTRWYVSSGWAW